MIDSDARVRAQEEEYWFPYHYVSRMPVDGFRQHFVDTWGINYISTIELVLQQIGRLKPKSVVDVGCGDGRLTREVYRRFGAIDCLGVDVSSRAVALARAMNEDCARLRFECRDIIQQEVTREFDVAVLMEVYEHIPPDQTVAFLHAVRRLLKPGGHLILTVPHSNKPLEYKHFQHFTIAQLVAELNPCFEVVEAVPFERRGVLRGLLNMALCNRFFVLNSAAMLRWAYELHSRYLVRCKSEAECQRIIVRAIAKPLC